MLCHKIVHVTFRCKCNSAAPIIFQIYVQSGTGQLVVNDRLSDINKMSMTEHMVQRALSYSVDSKPLPLNVSLLLERG